MSNLDKAISIAIKAHSGQLDKAGQPYILHPLRLMLKFQSNDEMIVAILHDVVEDSSVTIEDLKDYGFSEVIIKSIDSLTKRSSENYDDFIRRVSNNNLAKLIKVEDIRDNLDLTRLELITEKDLARVEKYHRALKFLVDK